jgi:long-chain fatty acid transport protein
MRNTIHWPGAIVFALGIIATSNALATNGYYTHGTGTKNKGMVGAGIALPQDSVDGVNNPAVAVLVGENMQLGAALFSPRRDYATWGSQLNGQFGAYSFGNNLVSSDSEYFVIPHFSRTWQRDNDTALAVSFYGRGGMNTNWKGGTAIFDPDFLPGLGNGPAPPTEFPGTFGAGDAGVDLSQAFLDLTWAKQINESTSLGITLILAAQRFEVKGVANFAGFTESFVQQLFATGEQVFPANLSNNGHDMSYGGGWKVGLHRQLSERTSFGVMYQSEIKMGEFDDYADLFAEDGGFDMPANFKIGLTYKPRENLAVSFDIEHTWFSEVDSVGNSIMNVFTCPSLFPGATDTSGCLGGANGGGFGWDDMTTYKLGVQWSSGGDWTWRAGFSYGEQPIPESEMTFNILAPAVMEQHLTFGFTKDSDNNREWNFAFMWAPENAQTGPNNFDPTQSVKWWMDQFELELSYGWKF